jgi:hypothetical protein
MKLEVGYVADTWGTVEAQGDSLKCEGPRAGAIRSMVAEHQRRHPGVSGEQLLAIILDSPKSYVWARQV